LATLDFDLGFYESMVEQMNGSAEQALADLKPKHLYRVRYEDILDEPIGELTKLGEWLGFADPAGWATQVAPKVKAPKPRPVPAVVAAASSALLALGHTPITVYVMLGMVVYMVAVRCRRTVAVALLGATELVMIAGAIAASTRSQVDAVRSLLVVAAVWFIGY